MTTTHKQILKAISSQKGVGYYNKDNKDKRDKTLQIDNDLSPSSSGIASVEALSPEDLGSLPLAESQERGALPHLSQAHAPTPLDANQIRSCIMQLFDNGEDSTQRYKFKLRLNLTDGTNPEFIASLTKDLRNFKKHIPEPNRQLIIDIAMEERKRIKHETGNWPYIGKLHLNQGSTPGRHTIQNEPDTLVIVWWDPEERIWCGTIKFHNWILNDFGLSTGNISPNQRAIGVKGQDTWKNPKYDKTIRPLTWAQKRGLTP